MAATPTYAWIDGAVVPWDEAKIHVRTQAILRGATVFEGLRAYWNAERQQLFLFRMKEHLARLWSGMKFLHMTPPYTADELTRACVDLLRANEVRGDAQLYLNIYVGEGEGLGMQSTPLRFGAFITGVTQAPRKRVEAGVHCCVSSWTRLSDRSMPPRVKSGANYQNSFLAGMQAKQNGFDGAILLTETGKVAEGPGSCLFMVRRGALVTPSITSGILESITRDTLIQLFREKLGTTAIEREVDRTELYDAEEVFFCGTAFEVTPILSVDRYPVGSGEAGPVTRRIQGVYFPIVRGDDPQYEHWLTPVHASVPAASGAAAGG